MRNRQGFTLVEIMIVVGIIAILTTVTIPSILRARLMANQAFARTTLKATSTALETYANDTGTYPPETTSLTSASPPYLNVDYFTGTHSGYTFTDALSNYDYTITAIPVGPLSGSTTYTITTGGVLLP